MTNWIERALRLLLKFEELPYIFKVKIYSPKTYHSLVSKIIKQTVEEGKIKVGDPSNTSTKFIYYIPAWA